MKADGSAASGLAAAPTMKTRCGGPPLSVTIVAQNEERTIADVLAGVAGIADEVIFLDSGSTDGTAEIARGFGVRFYHQEWLGYAGQKNRAIDLASGEWILSLDADEVVTPALAGEIGNLLSRGVPEEIAGFRIPRVLYIGGTPVPGGGFYPDAQLRLIRKGRGRFHPRVVHESMRVEGKVRQLKNCMLHHAYEDVEQFARTMDEYARLSARHYFEHENNAWRASRLNEVLSPAWTFFYRQVARGGLLQGPLCWRLNVIYAGYVRRKIRYLRQLVKSAKAAGYTERR
ncbi:MAG TPA: glycosyltransferase family 2 protein [Candidatus Binatia bacterium]|nr:glycosyltransferase family 2 protein [Candidatus Binatia bacterium]